MHMWRCSHNLCTWRKFMTTACTKLCSQLSWMFLVFTKSKYGIRKTKWKRCVREREGGVECWTTARELLWLPRKKTCVWTLRDSNRTCLHVDLVRNCRRRRSRRQTEEERERKKLSIRTADPSKAVEVEFSLFITQTVSFSFFSICLSVSSSVLSVIFFFCST
jgi:hypothetical protein